MKESESFLDQIDETFVLPQVDLRQYSPLLLAYIGDAVYELVIRTMLVKTENVQVYKLHKKSSSLVKAQAQAAIYDHIKETLTEEEQQTYKRGRNAKPSSIAKNASPHDYRKATGFEALVGYLYLQKKTGRILELVREGLEALQPDEAEKADAVKETDSKPAKEMTCAEAENIEENMPGIADGDVETGKR